MKTPLRTFLRRFHRSRSSSAFSFSRRERRTSTRTRNDTVRFAFGCGLEPRWDLFRSHARLALGPWLAIALTALSATAGEPAKPGGAPQPDPATLPAPQRTVVPKLSATLVHDGEFTEPVWAKAALLGPFVPAGGTGRAREATTVRVWYDDRAIHLGWTCTDSDIQATFTARDSKFWEEEVVEFFVTRQDLARYHELQWNPLGGVFDAVIRNTLDARGVSQKFAGDWSFTAPGMKSAVKVRGTVQNSADRDVEWQVEVSIPFADLGEAPPRPGEVWRANFYRFNRGQNQPAEMLSWSAPILNGFHQPSRFGYLEFGR